MKFNLPNSKDSNYNSIIFNFLSEYLTELRETCGKWPDKIEFGGVLGKEVFDFIIGSGWALSEFNPTYLGGILNFTRFSYSKPLHQIEDKGPTIFEKKLGDTQINGIPTPETMGKLVGAYSNFSYRLERTVSPKIEIILTRR
jgi:hypothetical protein